MENLTQITRNKSFTSRSAVLAFKVCPYKRYLQYELDGLGYTPGLISLDLLIGTVVHRGLQHLLEHCRLEHADGSFEEACIDQAVAEAFKVWKEILSTHQLWLHTGEEDKLDWIIAEQECLFAGLIRAFAARRLPSFLEEYEILEVEHEEVYEDFSSIVTFLGKADGLLRIKSGINAGKLVILSIKTASQYAEVTTRDILHDMQGVSEWAIVQNRLNKWFDIYEKVAPEQTPEYITKELCNYFESCADIDKRPEIFAVQYEYLLKGQRKQDPYRSNNYKQQSFLCHPYQLDAIQQIFVGQNAGSVINPAQYKWKVGAGKQSKGWDKCDIWNDIGIKAWIEMLCTGQVQPELSHPFDVQIDEEGKISGGILYTPDLVVRDEKEIEEWLVSTRFQEENIARAMQQIKLCDLEEIDGIPLAFEVWEDNQKFKQQLIWQNFPKNTLSCHNFYGKDCTYTIHCHELSSLEDLKDSGYLQKRESHHEMEREANENKNR